MLVDQGLNLIAQALSEKFTTGEVGTDNTEPTTGDTALASGITATQKAFTQSTVNSNLLTLIYELTVSEANGNEIKEFLSLIHI